MGEAEEGCLDRHGDQMTSEVEALARHLVCALYDATDGRPQVWRTLAGLGKGSESGAAVKLAVDMGWLLIEGGHSVCLTDVGRRLARR